MLTIYIIKSQHCQKYLFNPHKMCKQCSWAHFLNIHSHSHSSYIAKSYAALQNMCVRGAAGCINANSHTHTRHYKSSMPGVCVCVICTKYMNIFICNVFWSSSIASANQTIFIAQFYKI